VSKPRIVGPASELDVASRFCTCCDRPLKARAAWLELDQRTFTYHDRGDVPPERSQGWFPFGLTCAAKLNRAAARELELRP
jgi:hypothetical protein